MLLVIHVQKLKLGVEDNTPMTPVKPQISNVQDDKILPIGLKRVIAALYS
jgi:hypothetical protein